MKRLALFSKISMALLIVAAVGLSVMWGNLPSMIGWTAALIFCLNWMIGVQRLQDSRKEIQKIHKQDNETFQSLWERIEEMKSANNELIHANDVLREIITVKVKQYFGDRWGPS